MRGASEINVREGNVWKRIPLHKYFIVYVDKLHTLVGIGGCNTIEAKGYNE